MKKKIIKLLLITTLSTLILTGCKDSAETISNVDETTETTSVIESNEVAENTSDATAETTSTSETSETESASAMETSESETTSEIETSESESDSSTETTTEPVSTTTSESTEENITEENPSENSTEALTTNSEAIVSADFIVLLNAKRAEAGLSPVSMDANLDATALAGARELQTNMSHQVAGGGYDNCNIGYMSSVSVQGMFDGWWNSEGHRRAMMDPYLTHAAAAYCNGYIIFIGNIDEEAYLNSLDTPSTAPVTDPVNSTDVGGGQTVEVEGTPGAVREATDEEISAGEQFGWF